MRVAGLAAHPAHVGRAVAVAVGLVAVAVAAAARASASPADDDGARGAARADLDADDAGNIAQDVELALRRPQAEDVRVNGLRAIGLDGDDAVSGCDRGHGWYPVCGAAPGCIGASSERTLAGRENLRTSNHPQVGASRGVGRIVVACRSW